MTAERYTHGHHESVLRSHTWRTAENSAAYLLPHLRPGHRVLDVGCGPGTISADLAELVAPGPLVAVDNAPAVLDVARATLAERGVTNATVQQADVYRLPFGDAQFDVVHAHQVLQHLTDPVAALVEMRRVCVPGGLVAARDGDYPAMTWFPAAAGLDRWMAVYLSVARANRAEPAAGRRLLHWARAAGFSHVAASASVWCHATPDDRAWWGHMWADRVTGSAFAEQAVTGGFSTRTELDEIAAAWRRWAAADDGWFASLHGEVLCRH
jgi:ubiquinone/menaquinone biosynthesis C-methylase UbiE